MSKKPPLFEDYSESKPDVRAIIIFGFSILAGFALFFLLWSFIFPLDKAAIADGIVVVGSERRVVQHLEGGVIDKIYVKDGDLVQKGQVLLTLNKAQAEAKENTAALRYLELSAKEARLLAERDDLNNIVFPKELLDNTNEVYATKVKDAMKAEKDIFNDNNDTLKKMLRDLDEKINFLNTQVNSLQQQIQAEEDKLSYAEKEVNAAKSLLGKKYVSETDVWRLQQQSLTVRSAMNEHKAEKDSTNQQIAQTKLQITTVKTERKKRILDDLQKTQEELSAVKEGYDAAKDILGRTEIRAPITGKVMNLDQYTEGGVIKSGETIMEIVPENDDLIIKAYLQPRDIDMVHQGMLAKVQLTAYLSRRTPMVLGKVTQISADAMENPKTGTHYFEIKVTIDKGQLEKLKNIKLYPGMPAQVSLIVEERTFWDYLVTPITSNFDRAFREE